MCNASAARRNEPSRATSARYSSCSIRTARLPIARNPVNHSLSTDLIEITYRALGNPYWTLFEAAAHAGLDRLRPTQGGSVTQPVTEAGRHGWLLDALGRRQLSWE